MSTVYDVAVVGSSGFLGGAIARDLERRGRAVARFTRQDPVRVDDALAGPARDVAAVVWAAGSISPTVAAERPDMVDAELADFRATVAALAALPTQPRIVLLSSGGAVYGRPAEPPYAEADAPHPPNAYGEYKRAEEEILAAAPNATTAIRVANAYGPGQTGRRGQGVLAIWMNAVAAEDPIVVHGSGKVARDYVYVDDVADAVARVLDHPEPPPVVNVGSGVPTRLADLLGVLRATVGQERVRVEHRPSRGVDPDSTWLDVSLAREVLGWEPATTLADGVARMWDRRSS